MKVGFRGVFIAWTCYPDATEVWWLSVWCCQIQNERSGVFEPYWHQIVYEAVLTCTHNLCLEQKLEKYHFFFLAEDFQFLKLKKYLFITWACFPNEISLHGKQVLQDWVPFLLLCLPPTGSGDILFFPVRLSVCLSVCLSVRHKLCPLYNLKTVKDFSMKLGTLVNHDVTMCHAQEP